MKQLLKSCGDFLVVGFSDRAYLACAAANKVFELSPSPALVASKKVEKEDDPKEDDKQQCGREDPPKENNAPCRDVQSVAITSNFHHIGGFLAIATTLTTFATT